MPAGTAWLRRGAGRATLAALALASALGCGRAPAHEAVVYTSVDQPVAEPVLRAFEARAGIRVRPVYDVEAAKSTGLANRLLAERGAPRADLFWSSEVAQTLRLASEGALSPYRPAGAEDVAAAYRDAAGLWTGNGLRARVILVNTARLPESLRPATLEALADPRWKPGDVGFANPLFGTSATHMAALYAARGPGPALGFYRRLRETGARVLDGNSVVRDLVARGELAAGLTDTDDAQGALDAGAPVAIIFPDAGTGGTLYIPCTVALVAGGPHPAAARALADYLTGAAVEERLLREKFLCASVRRPPEGIAVEWAAVYAQMERAKADASALFLK